MPNCGLCSGPHNPRGPVSKSSSARRRAPCSRRCARSGSAPRSRYIGRLRTYQLYEGLKTRGHLAKLNTENLRKAAPRLWVRLAAHEEELAKELAQAVLVSNLELIRAVLDFLGIPNQSAASTRSRCCCCTSTTWPGNWSKRPKCSSPRNRGFCGFPVRSAVFTAAGRPARGARVRGCKPSSIGPSR